MYQVVDDFAADYKTTYMQYRLLRNNKESGPFTALQLKEMGLRPYDLLWTEGRGSAWQYASEITELKDFAPVVEEQPFERFYKRKEVLESVQQPVVAAKKVKPRYRISNGQLIMVEAGSMEVGTNGVIKETAPVRTVIAQPAEKKMAEQPDWQDMYPQWQPPASKAEALPEIETKYSESLDDLKKRYAEKVLGEKKETSSSSSLSSASVKQNIMAVAALVVLAVGGYVGYTLKKKDDATVTSGKPTVERADIAGDNTSQIQQPDADASAKNKKISNSNTPNNSQAVKNESQPVANNNTNKAITATITKEKSKKPVEIVTQKKSAEALAKNNGKPADKTANKPVVPNTKQTGALNNNAASQASATPIKNNSNQPVVSAPPVVKSASKQISDYIAVKKVGGSGTAVQNVKLMVSNVSDFPIDLAVVDIQYYDSKGKFQKGETMYVKDINGGNNVEVRVPDSEKSSSIKYKISMVQADQKTLYLVAD